MKSLKTDTDIDSRINMSGPLTLFEGASIERRRRGGQQRENTAFRTSSAGAGRIRALHLVTRSALASKVPTGRSSLGEARGEARMMPLALTVPPGSAASTCVAE